MFFYTFYTTIPPIWTKRTSISFFFFFAFRCKWV